MRAISALLGIALVSSWSVFAGSSSSQHTEPRPAAVLSQASFPKNSYRKGSYEAPRRSATSVRKDVKRGARPYAASKPTSSPGPVQHTVQKGQNLYRIALSYGITMQELCRANGISDPSSLQADSVLLIPRRNAFSDSNRTATLAAAPQAPPGAARPIGSIPMPSTISAAALADASSDGARTAASVAARPTVAMTTPMNASARAARTDASEAERADVRLAGLPAPSPVAKSTQSQATRPAAVGVSAPSAESVATRPAVWDNSTGRSLGTVPGQASGTGSNKGSGSDRVASLTRKEIAENMSRIEGSRSEGLLASESLDTHEIDQDPAGSEEAPSGVSYNLFPSKESFSWPVQGGLLRSEFGMRWGRQHAGIDISVPLGSPVYSSRDGQVVYSGHKYRGYGNVVMIDHGDGFVTVYAHNSRNLVREGQKVVRGQMIARVGATGNATGTHCHFEIRHGNLAIDPRKYLSSSAEKDEMYATRVPSTAASPETDRAGLDSKPDPIP